MNNPESNALRSLGNAIRDRRAALGYSQEELAQRAGLDRSYVGGVERGQRNVAFVNICRIAHALGLSLTELMNRVESQ
jgi:transcriptional regulator with XRE-family HTH domain